MGLQVIVERSHKDAYIITKAVLANVVVAEVESKSIPMSAVLKDASYTIAHMSAAAMLSVKVNVMAAIGCQL